MKISIIGTGLSSLALAKALVNQNIKVDLITEKKIKVLNRSRTIGVSKANVEFFKKNIVDISKIIWKLKKIEIYSDNLKKEKLINFENQNQELFSILKNYDLFQLLKRSLHKNKYFNEISFNQNLSILKNYDLIINTDHSNSITKKYFSKKIVKVYNCFAYTAVVKHNDIENDTATQIFTKKGPLAFLPTSRNETSIVYSIHLQKNKKKQNIEELIKYYNPKYKIKKIEKINSFELKSLNLRSYYHNNILAFGDLLHKVHPLAGQGFNMTVRDISALLSIIQNKKSLGLPLDSLVNKEFEKSKKHINYIFSNGVDLIYDFFNFERKINTNVISKSVKIIANNQYINKLLINFADKGIHI